MTILKPRLTDWLNAFKADPFSTGADKVDRLLSIIAEADTRLIALAPEMFEALECIQDDFREDETLRENPNVQAHIASIDTLLRPVRGDAS
jgi:hypothetical protein